MNKKFIELLEEIWEEGNRRGNPEEENYSWDCRSEVKALLETESYKKKIEKIEEDLYEEGYNNGYNASDSRKYGYGQPTELNDDDIDI